MLKPRLSIFFFITFLWVFSTPLWAAQITINPRVIVGEEYTDNLELSEDNRESEYITTVSPGVTGGITGKDAVLEVSYVLTYVKYHRFESNDTFRHRAGLSAGFDLTPNDKFELTNTFIRSEEPNTEEDPTFRRRSPHFTNTFTAGWMHRFDSINSIFGRYSYRILENEDTAIEDNQMHNPTFGITYWFTKLFGIVGGAAFTRGEFETSDNFDEWSASLRFISRLSRRLNGFFQYRHTLREHQGITEDYQVYDPSIGIELALSKNNRLTLQAGYYFQDRRVSSDEGGFSGSANLTTRFQNGSLQLSGEGGFTSTDFGAENLGSTRFYQLGAEIVYRLMQQLSTRIYGRYRTAEYTDLNREDDLIVSGFNLSYQPLKWLSFNLEYSYRIFDSNVDTIGYEENRVFFGATMTPAPPWRISD